MIRTPEGAALDHLMDQLLNLASDDLSEDEWKAGVLDTLLSAPVAWPMDDQLFEELLHCTGADLDHPDGLAAAVGSTCFLLGTGHIELGCSHADEPTTFCEAYHDDRNQPMRDLGKELRTSQRVIRLLADREARRTGALSAFSDGQTRAA